MSLSIQPLVTVIIPTYNRGKFIVETVESVLNQSYSNIELIVIDDGSSDNTKEVLTPYFDRIIYMYHDNIGENKTVNTAYKIANGSFIIIVNSDDPLFSNDAIAILAGVLINDPEVLAVYPDWVAIDDKGNLIKEIYCPSYNIHTMLRNFNCTLGPGMMIRHGILKEIGFRNEDLCYTGDLDISFRLALRGKLHHVPLFLATHREHRQTLSANGNRLEIAREVVRLAETSFASPLLPAELHAEKSEILKKIYDAINPFECILLFNYSDLEGNKFNSHDLHLYLQERSRKTRQLVMRKYSSGDSTFEHKITDYRLFTKKILESDIFIDADIIHFHLLHNTLFDINYLPIVSMLKPVVWTIHDPWALGGHCVHHGDCLKWQTHCCDCPYPDAPFALLNDTSALEFEIKKRAIQNSHIHAIVASQWMENKLLQSPIWKNKTIHRISFGINQSFFKPIDLLQAKQALGIDPAHIVFFARTQNHFKGTEILNATMKSLPTNWKYTLLTVGEPKGLLSDLPPNVTHIEYGWINDDRKLLSLYQACDIFLMPSEREAFGMMAIEAMSCGKLVLALDTPFSALPEVINSPYCGLAVTKDRYASELVRLLNSPEEILERGKRSLHHARQHYSHITYVDKILEVYSAAMNDFNLTDTARLIMEQLKKYTNFPILSSNYYNIDEITPDIYARLQSYYKQHGFINTCKKIMEKARHKIKS